MMNHDESWWIWGLAADMLNTCSPDDFHLSTAAPIDETPSICSHWAQLWQGPSAASGERGHGLLKLRLRRWGAVVSHHKPLLGMVEFWATIQVLWWLEKKHDFLRCSRFKKQRFLKVAQPIGINRIKHLLMASTSINKYERRQAIISPCAQMDMRINQSVQELLWLSPSLQNPTL